MSLKKIATDIYGLKENIALIYAFNATGKTRLSVEYKDITKANNGGNHAGVYYNAYSEDLFVWDNDDEKIKLDIYPSNLNVHYSSLTEEIIRDKLLPYKHKYHFEFVVTDAEKGIDSIIFFENEKKEKQIKISRGEERIFVLCFFLALFEASGLEEEQEAHFFIDDPVSSLDEHNIFITASTVFELIEKHFSKKKIIVTSHHFGFLSILSDWLGKGQNADKFRNRDKSKKYKEFVLETKEGALTLTKADDGVFLYHLRLLQILDEAIKTEIYMYHFALLRQIIENIASFLGVGQFSYVLEQIGITDKERVAFIVNALSHQNVYRYQSDTPNESNKNLLKEVFEKLMIKYQFILHKD
jgi:wobble nucleotide-excising tRNase